MDFKEFKSLMEQDVRAALEDVSPGVKLRQEEISKLQGQFYTALTVTPADGNVGMDINLTQLYKQMQSGVPYDAVLDEAVDLATDQLDVGLPVINPSRITDYEQAKQMLCVEVVGTARNSDMLEKVPHTDIEDMSMVYRVQLGQNDRSAATILVTNEMLERYGVSKEQLHADALESTQQVRPATIQTIYKFGKLKLLYQKRQNRLNYLPKRRNPRICVQERVTFKKPRNRAVSGLFRACKALKKWSYRMNIASPNEKNLYRASTAWR